MAGTRRVTVEFLGKDTSVGSTVSKVTHETGLLGSTLGKVGTAAAVGLSAVATGVGALGVMGLKTAAANEQAKISFTTMLGSGRRAASFLKDLQHFAATTPFEFPQLQQAASQLIAVGLNAKDVIPIMTTLGDITSGMGTGAEGIQRATVAIQQMNAAGKITAEDLNQLRDAGVPVFELLAKATGKSTTEVAQLAQAGKLGRKELDALMNTLKSGKGLERFAGLMQKQSHTLVGVWSTLKDNLGQGLARAIEPALPAIKNLVDTLSGGIQGALSWVTRLEDRLKSGGGFHRAMGMIQQAVDDVRPTLDDWGDAIQRNVIAPIRTVGPRALQNFAGGFKDLADAIHENRGEIRKVGRDLHPLLGLLGKGMAVHLLGLSASFRGVTWVLRRALGPALRFIHDQFSDLRWNVHNVTSRMSRDWHKLPSDMRRVGRAVSSAFLGPFRDLGNVAGRVTSRISRDWRRLPADAARVGHAISSAFSAAWAFLRRGNAGVVADIKGMFSGLTSWFGGLGGRVSSAVGDLSGVLVNAGRQILQGLSAGIDDAWGSVQSKLSSLTAKIPDWKGPRERDLVLLRPAGVAIMRGLVHGIMDGQVPLKKALEAVTGYIRRHGEKLKALVEARHGVVQSFREMSSSVFGADLGTVSANGVTRAPTAGSLVAYQRQQQHRARQLAADIRKLRRAGISDSLLRQMVNSGESGWANIHALAGGSRAQVRALNAANAGTLTALTRAGQGVGTDLYAGRIRDQRQDIRIGRQIEHALERVLKHHDKRTVVEVRIDGRHLHTALLRHKRKRGKGLDLG